MQTSTKERVETPDQLWALYDNDGKLLKIGSFGEVYEEKEKRFGVVRNPAGDINGEATRNLAEMRAVWSVQDYTTSDRLQGIITDTLDVIANDYHEAREAGEEPDEIISEAINSATPIYTQDIIEILSQDLTIATSEPEAYYVGSEEVNSPERIASAMIYETMQNAIREYNQTISNLSQELAKE